MSKALDYALMTVGILGAVVLLAGPMWPLGLTWLAVMFRYSGLIILPKN